MKRLFYPCLFDINAAPIGVLSPFFKIGAGKELNVSMSSMIRKHFYWSDRSLLGLGGYPIVSGNHQVRVTQFTTSTVVQGSAHLFGPVHSVYYTAVHGEV